MDQQEAVIDSVLLVQEAEEEQKLRIVSYYSSPCRPTIRSIKVP